MNITGIAQYAGWGLLAIFVIIVLALGFMLYKDRTPVTKEPKVKQKKEKKSSEPVEKKIFSPTPVEQGLEDLNDSLLSTETFKPATTSGFTPVPTTGATQPVQPAFKRPQMPSVPNIPQPQSNPNPTPPTNPVNSVFPNSGGLGGPPVLKRNAPGSLFSKNNDE